MTHKEHGLLFSPPMAAARFRGHKWETRRVITARNSLIDGRGSRMPVEGTSWEDFKLDTAWVDAGHSPAGNAGPYLKAVLPWPGDVDESTHRIYPRIQPGHRIWWKEVWNIAGWDHDSPDLCIHYPATPGETRWVHIPEEADPCADIQNKLIEQSHDDLRRAGQEPDAEGYWPDTIHEHARNRSSMLMYRWAARFCDPVVAVRPERLLSISDEDALAEGVVFNSATGDWSVVGLNLVGRTPSECYLNLMAHLHGESILDQNPWLWVYTMNIHPTT